MSFLQVRGAFDVDLRVHGAVRISDILRVCVPRSREFTASSRGIVLDQPVVQDAQCSRDTLLQPSEPSRRL